MGRIKGALRRQGKRRYRENGKQYGCRDRGNPDGQAAREPRSKLGQFSSPGQARYIFSGAVPPNSHAHETLKGPK